MVRPVGSRIERASTSRSTGALYLTLRLRTYLAVSALLLAASVQPGVASEARHPSDSYHLRPPAERSVKRIPCAAALAMKPLSLGRRGVDMTPGFAEVFGRAVEGSDCKREQILRYVERLGGRRQQPPLRAGNVIRDYYLLNTSQRPWYFFWIPEYLIILSFDQASELINISWLWYDG
jgi:hypothetical protein